MLENGTNDGGGKKAAALSSHHSTRARGVPHFVVYTQNNAERRAYDALRRLGCEPYFPRVKVRRAHAGKIDWAYRPFLPRYMFVPDQMQGVSGIKRADGVHDVVRAGFEPVRVQQLEIDAIREREVGGFVQLFIPLVKTFRPGQLLRVVEGEHQDHNAIFSHMRGETRAIIFLDAVIGRVTTEVPLRAVEARNERAA